MAAELFLNRVPDRAYRLIVHVDTEAHCLEGMSLRKKTVVVLDSDELPALPRGGEIGIVRPPSASQQDFCGFLDRLSPRVREVGIRAEEVLVVTDCWGKTGPDCRGVASVYEEDWSDLERSPFDISLWDGKLCSLGHEQTAVCLAQ